VTTLTGVAAHRAFGEAFARATGLSSTVVEAWLMHEQPAGEGATPGSNNWLNIGYEDSGPNSEYYRIAAMSPADAGVASAKWLARQSGLRGILASRGTGEENEAHAIVASGWASSHYYWQPASAFLAEAGPLGMAHSRADPNASTVAGVSGSTEAPGFTPTVDTNENPKDRSPKIIGAGKLLGKHGSDFYTAVKAMQTLTARHLKLRV
jgi:hypothetical protein